MPAVRHSRLRRGSATSAVRKWGAPRPAGGGPCRRARPPRRRPKPIRSGAPRPRISSPSCCGREHWSCGTIRRGHSAPIANSWCTRPPSARVSGRSTPTTPRTSTASMGKRPRQPVVGGTRVGAETPRAIHLAHSPDADDAFMFWALAAGRIDTAGRRYIHELADIEAYVAAGRADAGLLIHEGQLTYADRGLHLWVDLGEWWYRETGLPLPLGGNAVRRDLGPALMGSIARDLKASIQYGLAHRAEALAHAQAYSPGLDDPGTDRFVGMSLNAYTFASPPTGPRPPTHPF